MRCIIMKAKIVSTVYLNNIIETKTTETELVKDDSGVEMPLVNIYPEVEYQEFSGFGGAFTEAAGYTLSQMSDDVYSKVINDYFGEEGLNYTFCRTHIDSCDFSLGNYSAMADKDDLEFRTFSLDRDNMYIIPMIKRAAATSKNKIKLLLSPWSPPAFMKTNGQKNRGGKLKKEYYKMWAEYLCKYIMEYRKMGLEVTALSIQNEPKAVQPWDSCVYTAQEEGSFISDFLAPQLRKDGLEDIEIIIWDHNKERAYERARDVFEVGNCREEVAGIGLHWYSGDHFEALEIIRKLYPDKKLLFTEGCVEYSRYKSDNQLKNAQMYAHEIIGDLNAGINAFIDWNLVLDEKGGPNHVGNFCDAPIMCDTKNNTYEKKLSYTYIGHFSKYILPGAIRIGYSKYTDKLEVTAFKNTDGSIAVIVLNRNAEAITYILRINDNICKFIAEPNSINTIVF